MVIDLEMSSRRCSKRGRKRMNDDLPYLCDLSHVHRYDREGEGQGNSKYQSSNVKLSYVVCRSYQRPADQIRYNAK